MSQETDCKVFASPFDPLTNENIPAVDVCFCAVMFSHFNASIQFRLPSDEIVKVHMERFELTEFMFNASLLKRHANASVLDLFAHEVATGNSEDVGNSGQLIVDLFCKLFAVSFLSFPLLTMLMLSLSVFLLYRYLF